MTPDNIPGTDRDTSATGWRYKAIVQEGRAAATRGLLHDFGNVMVGLCSISENAVEDVPADNPLRGDLEIIRDSAMRAYQLIRRLVQLNAVEPAETDLIECRSWLAGEAESLRAVLPKGSSVEVDPTCEAFFIRAREDALRDALIVMCLAASRRRRARINVLLSARKVGTSAQIELRDQCAEGGSASSTGVIDESSTVDIVCCAQRLGGDGSVEHSPDGAACTRITLPLSPAKADA